MNNYTIIIFAENRPGVLYRIADLFLRRKINIESLTVSETENAGISRFTIVVQVEPVVLEKTVKQLYRIIEVVKVYDTTDEDLIFKEVALIKVSAKNPEQRRQVSETASMFSAVIAFIGQDFLTVEKTGSEEEINSLYQLLRPFGIREFVRSGRIAVLKGEKKLGGKFSLKEEEK